MVLEQEARDLSRLFYNFFAEPCQDCPGGRCGECLRQIVIEGLVLLDDIPEANQIVAKGNPSGHIV